MKKIIITTLLLLSIHYCRPSEFVKNLKIEDPRITKLRIGLPVITFAILGLKNILYNKMSKQVVTKKVLFPTLIIGTGFNALCSYFTKEN